MKAGALVRHSFLNLFRNKRRTIMILFILGASMAIIFVTNCYLAQMYRGMRMGYISQTGALQIARKGFWDLRREGDLLMDGAAIAAVTELLRGQSEVARVNEELSLQGMIGTEKRSTIVNGMGVQPDKQGGYAGYILVDKGSTLDAQDLEGILIGKPIAEKLGLDVGEYVTIMTTTVDGTMNLVSARIAGIVTTGIDQADAYFSAANLSFIQELRNTKGIDRLLVFLRDEGDLKALRIRLEARIVSLGLGLEIKTWEDLNPFYFELKSLYDGIFLFIKAIISVLVFLAVMEIISMSFFERFRELGTLRAIGNTRGEILLILLVEVMLYSTVGAALGAGIGVGIASILNGFNLSWTPPGSSTPVPFGFFIRAESITVPLLIIFVASILAAIVPAIRSARNQVAEVLKYE